MHGIERIRETHGSPQEDNGVVRVVVNYSNGKVLNFVPDASRDVFSEDDILELKKVFDTASSTYEWAEVSERGTM